MRVLHFFKTYWPDTFGGVERTIHALASGGSARGLEVDVLTVSRKSNGAAFEFDGHRVHQAALDIELASTSFSRQAFGLFRELSGSADIIHYHFPWPFMDLMHLMVRPRKPAVVTYHSDVVKQRLLYQAYRPLMHGFLTSVDRIVATSPQYRDTSSVLQRHRDKTVVIPLGLGTEACPPSGAEDRARWRQRLPRPFFLFVGVLRYYKGLHVLIEAARGLQADVVIAGKGPMERELRAQAERSGAENVRFLGAVNDADKAALMDLCTGFVLPSHLRSEAYGLSLVEAAMHGRPMISCENGTGSSLVNRHGETGLVVSPNDPEALAGAMRRMLQAPGERFAMGQAARAHYEAHLQAESMVTAYLDLYQDLLNNDL